MPNIKSAKKRVLVTDVKTKRNNMMKTSLKNAIKKFDSSIESNDTELINNAYTKAVSTIDKAAAKGVIKKNSASNKKASLGKKLSAKTTK
ncbi:MAG: 30S ribosomal protein S20 [Clostridia bacterium]|nr:30S ribosomal protein S20 [Clostridia bacterium]